MGDRSGYHVTPIIETLAITEDVRDSHVLPEMPLANGHPFWTKVSGRHSSWSPTRPGRYPFTDEKARTATGRTIAYCRVSARDQNPQLQHDALAGHGYDTLFTEAASGRNGDRPEWQRCLTELRDGDTLVCWKVDRFGRSAAHVLTVMNELRERGVTITSLTENFDLETKEGRLDRKSVV